MKPSYEKTKKKIKLSKPLVIGLIASGILLIIATVIFCIFWYKSIFNEQTFTITIMIVVILAVLGIGFMTWKLTK